MLSHYRAGTHYVLQTSPISRLLMTCINAKSLRYITRESDRYHKCDVNDDDISHADVTPSDGVFPTVVRVRSENRHWAELERDNSWYPGYKIGGDLRRAYLSTPPLLNNDGFLTKIAIAFIRHVYEIWRKPSLFIEIQTRLPHVIVEIPYKVFSPGWLDTGNTFSWEWHSNFSVIDWQTATRSIYQLTMISSICRKLQKIESKTIKYPGNYFTVYQTIFPERSALKVLLSWIAFSINASESNYESTDMRWNHLR